MKLTKTEKTIYDYCRENSEKISSLKIEELAELTFTTGATISKMVKKMKFANYYEFKLFFKNQYTQTIDVDDINSFSTEYIKHFTQAIISIDIDSITDLASEFDVKRTVVLYGIGSSGLTCKYLKDNLLRLGYNCIYDIEYFICSRETNLQKDPLIICVSNSGVTPAIYDFLGELTTSPNIYFITSNKTYDVNYCSIRYSENAITNSMFSNNSMLTQITIVDHLLHELSKKTEVHSKFNSIYF